MLYHWFEMGHAAVKPARLAAGSARLMLNHPWNPISHTAAGRSASAAFEVFERTTRRYAKPDFGITTTQVDGRDVAVREDVVWERVRWDSDFGWGEYTRVAGDPGGCDLFPC